MDVKLVIEQGSSATKTIRLRSVETIIGRQSGCDLRIPSGAVSRKHCRLSFHDDFLTVEDLDSANGTVVNGERIEGPHVLRPGDRLEVGPVTFVVKYQLTPAAIDRLLREGGDAQHADVDVEPVDDDVPEIDVEQLEVEDDTDVEEKAKKAPRTEEVKKAPAKPPPKKPVKTQQMKKKPVEKKKAEVPADEALDPDVAAMLDGEKSWHMPSNDDFRDFLTHMEE